MEDRQTEVMSWQPGSGTDDSGWFLSLMTDREQHAIEGLHKQRVHMSRFLDADDVWLPTYLEHSVGILDAYPSVVSVSGAWIDYPKGIPVGPVWSARGVPYGAHQVAASTPLTILDVMDKFMNPSTTVMRTDVARRLGGFPGGQLLRRGQHAVDETAPQLPSILSF
jgi:hypothetical protein